MNSLASSGRCRAIRCPLEMAIWRKSSSHPWATKNHSIACVRQASSKSNPGIMSRLKNIFQRSSDMRAPMMSPWTRCVMDLAPRKAQPPIREPNMPEKRDKKDEKKKQKDKKPVLKTESNSAGENENWSVGIPDDHQQPRGDEHSAKYVMNHIWSVNAMKNPKLENETVQNSTSADFTGDSESTEEQTRKKIENMSLDKDMDMGVTNSFDSSNHEIFIQNPEDPVTSISRPNLEVLSNEDYNIPMETPQDGEISAWQEVVERSKLNEELALRAMDPLANPIQSIFIRPEPPQPKLDVQVIGSSAKHRNLGNDDNSLDLSPDATRIHLTLTKKFHTSTNCFFTGTFNGNLFTNWYSTLTTFDDGKDYQIVSFDGKTFDPSSNAKGNNFASMKKFHTCTKCISGDKFHDYHCPNWYSTSTKSPNGDGKDFQTFPPETEDFTRTETDERKQVRAPQDDRDLPKVAVDFKSVLQDLSQREMEVFLSYNQQTNEETGTLPRLPTSVKISTFPPGTCRNSSDLVELNDAKNFNIGTDNHAGMTELEKTILKLNEREDGEDGKHRKDKKGHKDGDYIRIPGDPYPYSREHFEKWRVPHGRCPIVNDDVPKVKPAETSDSQCCFAADNRSSRDPTTTITGDQKNYEDSGELLWSSAGRKEKRKLWGFKRVTAAGAEQPTDRVQTIHPDIAPPKRGVVEDSMPKDQTSKLVINPQSIDVKSSGTISSKNLSDDPASIRQRRNKIYDKVEADRVYELKNYAYTRPVYIKNR